MAASATEDDISPPIPTRASLSELGGLVCVCAPAKPVWSEVIIFLADFLRQKAIQQEDRTD